MKEGDSNKETYSWSELVLSTAPSYLQLIIEVSDVTSIPLIHSDSSIHIFKTIEHVLKTPRAYINKPKSSTISTSDKNYDCKFVIKEELHFIHSTEETTTLCVTKNSDSFAIWLKISQTLLAKEKNFLNI